MTLPSEAVAVTFLTAPEEKRSVTSTFITAPTPNAAAICDWVAFTVQERSGLSSLRAHGSGTLTA